MKQWVKDILIFLVPLVLVFAATEGFYRTADSSYTLKHKQIRLQANDIETLIMGDSQSFFGINPAYFDKPAFNLANISQPLYFDKLLFHKYIDSLANLKTIVLPVGINSLSHEVNTFDMSWRKYFYNVHMDLRVPHIKPYDLKSYSLALTRRFKQTTRTLKKYIKDGSLEGCDANGWGNYYRTEESLDLVKTAKYSIQVHNDGSDDYDDNIKLLQNVIKLCNERNIDVKIVFMPVSKVYADGINDKKEKQSDSVFSSLDAAYKHVSYLNLYQERSFSDADFYDANHLNTQGAIKCTKFINEYLNKKSKY